MARHEMIPAIYLLLGGFRKSERKSPAKYLIAGVVDLICLRVVCCSAKL